MSKSIDQVCASAMYVLIEDTKITRDKTDGGLIIPDSAKKTEWFRVLSVGPECTKGYTGRDGEKKMLKPGDRIQFFQGVNIDIEGNRYQAVPENNVMVVWPKEAQ